MAIAIPLPDFQYYRGPEPPEFAHPAELELAKILEHYQLAWDYEPHAFVLKAIDESGATVEVGPAQLVDGELPEGWQLAEAFRPDFYLPERKLYIETTLMKQSLTTRKNRKARQTSERYGVAVRILYRRDFEILAELFDFELPPPGQTPIEPQPINGIESDSSLSL